MTDNHLTMSESVPRVPKTKILLDLAVQILKAQYYTEGIKAQAGRFRFNLPTWAILIFEEGSIWILKEYLLRKRKNLI
jgi:hypothetical protein